MTAAGGTGPAPGAGGAARPPGTGRAGPAVPPGPAAAGGAAAAPSRDAILGALRERAKELSCLYETDEILGRADRPLDEVLAALVAALPRGWRDPEHLVVRVTAGGHRVASPGFVESPWSMAAEVAVDGAPAGSIEVRYPPDRQPGEDGPFLGDERRLLAAVAERLGQCLRSRHLGAAGAGGPPAAPDPAGRYGPILEFLRATDRKLLVKLTRRMINHLGWSGIAAADALLHECLPTIDDVAEGDNRPLVRTALRDLAGLADRAFRLAVEHLGDRAVLECLRVWILEDRVGFLYGALEDLDTSLTEIAGLLERYHAMRIDAGDLPLAMRTGLEVALLRRFFSDDLRFLQGARDVVEVDDFRELTTHTVLPPQSHGRLGGKAAGLFLASHVAARSPKARELLHGVRVPRTWYVASDAQLHFVRYNALEEIYDRKYRELELVRRDYPYVVQLFKASRFPPDVSRGLAAALDDLGDRPIIVRSSSLLEDRVGSAFAGKYKSLFLANQGTPAERLTALEDAIAEVYASVFGPDPIEYRARRGLLDVHEEMGILIQEVVGRRIGPWFLPAYSGVAYGTNEFRWSSRIRRADGLVRLVPGLGTRAVDRLTDDYPVLVAPGQPQLRVNPNPDDAVRYAPRRVDVIDLESGAFATIEASELLRRHGREIPDVHRMVSIVDHGLLRKPIGTAIDFERQDCVFTFEGMIADTPLIPRIRALLEIMQERLGAPVDLEFAADGTDFWLLQCRAQGHAADSGPAAIPLDLPRERLVFSANRFVSNGRVPDVWYVVYVDEAAYAALPTPKAMHRVGEVVGQLNKLLPKRRFVLIGPGRWGSRGDIRLGVSVTYSQINNTAMLIEVARRSGSYVPDVSFGTHFFQDLVESDIRYLPLYPDQPESVFDDAFFRGAPNRLAELLPRHADLAPVVRVIDVRATTGGRVLRILQNAELDRAVAFLAEPDDDPA